MPLELPPRPASVRPKGLLFGTFLQISGQACEYCLRARSSEKFLRCSKCRRVYYCELFLLIFAFLLRRVLTHYGYLSGDEACQSQDWETHKELCSRLCLVNDAEASELIPRGKLSPDEYGDYTKLENCTVPPA